MKPDLTVSVYFDLICPWCYIGKRNLDIALARLGESHPETKVRVAWRSVQLLPATPEAGVDFRAFYEARLGGPAAVRARQAQVREAAARAGVEIDFPRIKVFPNTAMAHRLLDFASASGNRLEQDALLERLFAAYFNEGRDIGDFETLMTLCESSGLDVHGARSWAARSDAPGNDVLRRLGSGVPLYQVNDRAAISGAQDPEILCAMMCAAIAETRMTVPVSAA
jgi:predicted DsbA family dithiol-disulfide isomerase